MNKPSENFERKSESISVSMSDDWFEFADEEHFWMQWRFSVLKKLLKQLDLKGKRLLEIGCGNGTFISQMRKEGYSIDGCDLNIKALELVKKGEGKLFLYNIFDRNPDLINKYKSVFLLDVIEHVKEDTLFVKTAAEHASSDGYIVINVPAYKYLYSNYDVEAGHLRRYTKKQIKVLFKNCNISLIYAGYWGFFLIPVALLRKVYLRLFPRNIIKDGFEPPNKFVEGILKKFMNIELSLPFLSFTGTSLIAVGRINNTAAENE